MNLTLHRALISDTFQEIEPSGIYYEVQAVEAAYGEDEVIFWENTMPKPQEGIIFIVSERAFQFDPSLANRVDVVTGTLCHSEDGPYYYVRTS